MTSTDENVRAVKKMADPLTLPTNEKLLRIKTGYNQDDSPQNSNPDATLHKRHTVNNKTDAVLHKTSPALAYWKSELSARNEATKDIYLRNFNKFLEFTGKTPDELLKQRQEDQINLDRKIQRQAESQLIKFISAKREEGLAPATLQIYFAAVRSFYEIHYYPLAMRKGDYPKGESLGVRAATRQTILKAVENKANRNKPTMKAVILFLKDSGLRISDARLLDYGNIAEKLERGDSIIPITIITQKQKP